MGELERAQHEHVASAGTTSRLVTSVQVQKKELYAEAVAVFDFKSKGKRLSLLQANGTNWGTTLRAQQVLQEQVPVEDRNTRTRTTRTTKIRIGDACFDVFY